ncbi:MAG TPA: protoporphyrinogen oxidase [Bryobacteraceae bacterium]|nr:protoporphyrinogen oxidase [Bryobacteraceae bacterium]
MPRVVIVGGGIAGLSAAYDLTRAGVETIVFEKQPRLGGVIETRQWEGCTIDCGPDSFLSAKPEALALIKDLGLEREVIGSNDHQRTTYIQKNHKLVALPDGVMMIVPSKIMPMAKSPLLGWATKIRMGLELLRRPGPGTDRSVADFVIDHFGTETLDYLAEPLLSGVYGGDPAQLSVASVLPRFLEMEKKTGSLGRAVMAAKGQSSSGGSLFRTLKSGLGSMVKALSKDLNVRNETVQAIENGFRVRVAGDWIQADHVIVACPAWSAAEMLNGLDGGLAKKLTEIPYSSSLTLSLIYQASEFDGQHAGFGFLVPKRERRRLAACTFVGTKFPFRTPEGRVVLRCFFGGIGDEAVLNESDDGLIAIARDELQRILGLTAKPLFHMISRWPRSMAQYTVGHASRVKEIKERTSRVPGLYLAGNAYDGIGIPDCIRTGRAAAKSILSQSK